MSHDYHRGPEDAVLYDGCEECTERAADPLNALLNLDEANMLRLVDRVRAVEFGRDADHYRSRNEAQVGKALYRVLVLVERHPEVFTR